MESEILTFMMDRVMVCRVYTIAHVPRSVRPLLARVSSFKLRKACSSVWVFFLVNVCESCSAHSSY